jgi:hypothetical protein
VGRDKLSIVKVDQLLTRPGVNVPYRTLHRFAVQRCGFRPKDTTVPVMINFHGGTCPTLAARGKRDRSSDLDKKWVELTVPYRQ